MPEDENTGAAYLAALKRSVTAQPSGAAAARAPDLARSRQSQAASTPLRDANYAGPERRGSPRYECQGSARMQQAGSTVAMWATFTDISVSGCYVEAASTFGVGTQLSLKLEANGFRIEATGEVRATYPQLGMGISFSQISGENRERLRGLLRTIAPSSVIVGPHSAPRDFSPLPSSDLPPIADPTCVLKEIWHFFEDRHMMGRDEFLRILRRTSAAEK